MKNNVLQSKRQLKLFTEQKKAISIKQFESRDFHTQRQFHSLEKSTNLMSGGKV